MSANTAKKLVAYAVNQGTDGKDYFTAIGRAFPNPNKEGFTVKLNAMPVEPKIVVLPREESDDAAE